MGAALETVYGDDIAFQIAEFARLSGVSKIVMGRASVRRKFFGKPSLTERLTNAAPNLDIYIIPDKATTAYRRPKRTQAKPLHFSWADLLKTLLILAACTAIGYLFELLGFQRGKSHYDLYRACWSPPWPPRDGLVPCLFIGERPCFQLFLYRTALYLQRL